MKKNIVLVHGWGSDSTKLKLLENELKKFRWNTYIIKLPGFEEKSPNKAWNLDDYSKYVIKKSNEKFREKYFLFGHSFGGRIGIFISVEYYKKLNGVILCSSGGLSRINIIKRFVFFCLAKMGKIFIFINPISSLWKRLLYKAAREHDYEKTQGVMKETFRNIISQNLKKDVSSVKIPVLILWGNKDTMTPVRDAYYLKRKIKHSYLKIFHNQGHKLPYVAAKAVAAEIEKWFKQL